MSSVLPPANEIASLSVRANNFKLEKTVDVQSPNSKVENLKNSPPEMKPTSAVSKLKSM